MMRLSSSGDPWSTSKDLHAASGLRAIRALDPQAMSNSRRWATTLFGHMMISLCAALAFGAAASASDTDAPTTPTAPTSEPIASCAPATVSCKSARPVCPPGEVAEADPCEYGNCPDRCWTGRCVPCASECLGDADCALVGRHGCCGDAGDCENGCFFAEPRRRLEADACYFDATCPIPSQVPEGCPTACEDSPRCKDCPHCGPELARCEAGICVSAWPSCEPNCVCD